MASDLAPTEIVALARVIDELDYYQILHVPRGASMGEVKKAYHFSSRAFHPDANRHLPEEMQAMMGDLRSARLTPITASFFKMALPFIIVVVWFVAPDYLEPLLVNDWGNMVLASAFGIDVLAYFMALRIADVQT